MSYCNIIAKSFAYADDVIILAPTVTALKRLIKICENYSIEYRIKFNSNIIFFNNTINKYDIDINLKMNNELIPIKNECKHLGNEISSKNLINNSVNIVKDMKVKTNVLCSEFHVLNHVSRRLLFNSQCTSIYGCELLNLNNKNDIDNICVAWRKCCRRVVNVPTRTHKVLISKIMNTRNVLNQIENRILNFIRRNINHRNVIVKNIFQNSLSTNNSYLVTNINKILWKYSLKYIDIFKNKKVYLNDWSETDDWKINIINELLGFRDGIISVAGFSGAEVKYILHSLCTD